MRHPWIAATLLPASLFVGCGTEELQPRRFELVHVDRDEAAHQVSLAGRTDDAAAARALFVRERDRARVELELDGDRFRAELDPATRELTVLAEVDGETIAWTQADGPMPTAIAERWEDVLAAWRDRLLDDDGRLRADARSSVNVPADVFATEIDGEPVSQAYAPCPPEPICWYDDTTGAFICELAEALWCPPPPDPCWGLDCPPCAGLWCPPPDPCTTGGICPEPCIGLWCLPCDRWDPFCG